MSAAWWIVLVKELRETLRDRRVLMSALLVGPLLGPLMFAGMLGFIAGLAKDRETKPLQLPVSGQEHAPNLVAFLRQRGVDVQPAPDDAEARVRDRTHDVVLRIAPDYAASWSAGRPARVELVFDSSRQFAERSVRRARDVLQAWAAQTGALRLQVRGISPQLAAPLAVLDQDLSTPQSRAALALAMLPLLLLAAAFTGSLNIAIDTTTGERERQSLEALLITPASRNAIAAGKLLATTVFSLASLLVCIAGFALVTRFLPAAEELDLHFAPSTAVAIFALTVPIALLAASSQMIIASGVNSFKEAQGYLQLLVLLPMLPGLVHAVNPFRPELWVMQTPLLSQIVLIDRLLRGETVGALDLVLSAGMTLLLAVALVGVVLALYRRERIALT